MISLLLAAALPLLPWPAKVAPSAGRFPIDQSFRVRAAQPAPALDRFIARLKAKTGILVLRGGGAGLAIEQGAAADDESYTLTVTPASARLQAAGRLGVLRGLETFLQLVQPDAHGFAAPAVVIEDRPRFAWRGLLVDVARHFLGMDALRRTLDGMAAVKLNVLHLHLSDDQGFRVESKRYPKLHQLASEGSYFTQEQLRQLIAYAAARGIRVVPEFDMPAHTTGFLVAYPHLAALPGPYSLIRNWGKFDPVLDPAKDSVFEFLDGFLGEMSAVFPDPFIHIGGDEVNGKQWAVAYPGADKRELHAAFNERLMKIVGRHGKRAVGWDDVLHPRLPKDVLLHSWRDQKTLAQAVRQGHQALLSTGYYLDLMHPAAAHYAVDPGAGLSPAEEARVLGGEACMWSEFVTEENMDVRIWPRAAAIAERFWSPRAVSDVASLYERLEGVSLELAHAGLRHRTATRRMLERLAPGMDIAPLEVLAAVVEPVKGYRRNHIGRLYDSRDPLNRLVDAIPPESGAARRFGELAARGDRAAIRRWLVLWRDNDARLRPLLERSFLLRELAPISADLSRLAEAGLEALDGGKPAWPQLPAERAELVLVVAPHIRKLP